MVFSVSRFFLCFLVVPLVYSFLPFFCKTMSKWLHRNNPTPQRRGGLLSSRERPKIAILTIFVLKKVRIQLSSLFWVDLAQFRFKTWTCRRSYGAKTFGGIFKSNWRAVNENFLVTFVRIFGTSFLGLSKKAAGFCRVTFVGDSWPRNGTPCSWRGKHFGGYKMVATLVSLGVQFWVDFGGKFCARQRTSFSGLWKSSKTSSGTCNNLRKK